MNGYKREIVETDLPSPFSQDIKTKVFMRPELPKITFKSKEKNHKGTYTVTDIRLLNKTAIDIFKYLLEHARKHPSQTEVRLYFDEETDIDKINAVVDILISMDYSAKLDGGRYVGGALLVEGFTETKESSDGTKTVDVIMNRNQLKFIHDYYEKNGTINIYDLVIEMAETMAKELFPNH